MKNSSIENNVAASRIDAPNTWEETSAAKTQTGHRPRQATETWEQQACLKQNLTTSL